MATLTDQEQFQFEERLYQFFEEIKHHKCKQPYHPLPKETLEKCKALKKR